jgi:hypothetical protein
MMKKPRENTCNLLDAIEEGMFDPMIVLEAALLYMSDDEVGDMMHSNEFLIEEDEEDE